MFLPWGGGSGRALPGCWFSSQKSMLFWSEPFRISGREQTLIILHPKLGQMVNGIVLPIKKVFALVDSKISVEIKDEGRKLQGRLVAVDEYLNIHMDETIEFVDNQRGRSLGTVVIRGNNILTIAPVI
jgi:small nuclear ribonucleoprotein (snRNP)-like protein